MEKKYFNLSYVIERDWKNRGRRREREEHGKINIGLS